MEFKSRFMTKIFSGKHLLLLTILSFTIFSCASKNEKSGSAEKSKNPNIIIFYVDDLGYGDLGCYGGKDVSSPNLDQLAAKGLRFTDAHSTASTCTPSRYSLLTGQYAFRNNAAILPGDAPLLIRPGSYTLPTMLKKSGYNTAVIGKWHLGLGDGKINWNTDIKPGPLEIGFDYSYILPATGDRVPSVYVENYKVDNLGKNDKPIVVDYKNKLEGYPNGLDNPELLRQKADPQHSNTIVNGISRIGYMQGGESALLVDEDMPEVLTTKAEKFIANSKDKPFFLFYAFHDIHVPRLPHKQFAGKSKMGVRGDVITQMDWVIGRFTSYLEKMKIADNTIIIFTSDNGPVLNDGYEDLADKLIQDHKPSGPFRGGKYSAFEAGTRVPMIVYWPGKTAKGVSNTPISQVDIYASLAELTGHKLAADEAIDSDKNLNALLYNKQSTSTYFLEESYTTQIRNGRWKYIEPIPKTKTLPSFMKNKGIETGFESFPQLYDLEKDMGEQKNLAKENPDLIMKFQKEIENIRIKTKRNDAS